MLDGLVGLCILDLSRNQLTSLASGAFNGMSNLTFLNLGRNNIKKLPPTIFRSLTKLQQLTLSDNMLEMLEPGMFDELVNLVTLNIYHNQIASIPPQVFWTLRNLINLTLSSNKLQAIPEKSFYNMPKLSKLTIYNNPLLSLPDQLMGHMPEMTEFILYATNLTTVPENIFANMSGLLELYLNLNKQLRDLPLDLFCCLPNLQKLSLNSNDLHYLHPDLFSRLTTVKILRLNNNKLKSLAENIFQGLVQVLIIDLKNNHLKTLPGNIFLSNTALMRLYLSSNPWDCTCSIRGFARWIRQNEHVVMEKEDVMCSSPLYQMLRTVGSLRDEEFDFCEYPRFRSTLYTPKDWREPTQPFHTILTSGQTPVAASTTTNRPQQVTIATSSSPAKTTSYATASTALPNKELPVITETPSAYYISPPFYDQLVLAQGPEFVHHHVHKGWVYVWFLPSDPTTAGILLFCHILLVATGLFLILATMYGVHHLNKTMDELKAESANTA